jgi:hypothetical protein
MATDRYTKIVLTIIAACLGWISFGGPALITDVKAQQQKAVRQHVIIDGWLDAQGETVPMREIGKTLRGLPVLITNKDK